MIKIKIPLKKFLNLLADHKDHTVMVPVTDKNGVEFRPYKEGVEPCFSFVQSKNSLKELFFPRCEPVVCYNRITGESKDVEPKGAWLVVGCKPCDANGMEALQRLFSAEPEDIFFTQRRKRSLLVTQICTQWDESCFCSSTGGSPEDTTGSDVMMRFINEDVHLFAVTDAGAKWLESIADSGQPSDEELSSDSHAQPKAYFQVETVMSELEKNFEDVEFWKEASQRCLGCGICTFVCPTCHCFDLVDEGDYFEGCRMKTWDSCSFGMFTRHTSGHNPRAQQYERWRQRLNHKFRYFMERFQRHLCTGCGRCVRSCPVHLGVLETAVKVQQSGSEK
jgi:ferredoxin